MRKINLLDDLYDIVKQAVIQAYMFETIIYVVVVSEKIIYLSNFKDYEAFYTLKIDLDLYRPLNESKFEWLVNRYYNEILEELEYL